MIESSLSRIGKNNKFFYNTLSDERLKFLLISSFIQSKKYPKTYNLVFDLTKIDEKIRILTADSIHEHTFKKIGLNGVSSILSEINDLISHKNQQEK